MGRKGGSPIKRREAEAIAKKLGAEIKSKTNHDVAYIRVDGTMVGHYGMRRDKTAGHPHLHTQIYVTERMALDMARCTVSKEEYAAHVKARGIV